MSDDIRIDGSVEKAYGYVEQSYRSQWDEDTWDTFDYYYKNKKSELMMAQDQTYFDIEQRLQQERQINDLQNKYERNRARDEGRKPNPVPFDEYERRDQIRQEEEALYYERLSEDAARLALAEMRAMGYINDNDPDEFYDNLERDKQQAKVDEKIAQLAERIQLNLVRGAYLRCDCGSHFRMLNLIEDHGVTVKERPQIHIYDARPGLYGGGDGYNIGWFGHCSAPDHPIERIRLKPFVQVDMSGNHMQVQEDSTKEDFMCIPEFTSFCWNNAGEEQMNIRLDWLLVATLRSYIVCKHGGIIFPETSGQEEQVYMYTPDYADSPFLPADRTPNSDFMQWCDENGKCPYDPGTDDYNRWYNEKMNAVMSNKGESKEADELYQNWLAGMVQSGAADDVSTRNRINNPRSVNNVRETYYANSANKPSFETDVNAEKRSYGSNNQN